MKVKCINNSGLEEILTIGMVYCVLNEHDMYYDLISDNIGNTVGRKGISKCDEADEFDPYTGYSLAYYKAKHDKNFGLKRMFNGCIEYSKKKGYKQTIIKNK